MEMNIRKMNEGLCVIADMNADLTCKYIYDKFDIPVSDEELENAKNNIIGKWAFMQETNCQQACLAAHYGIQGLGFDFNEKLKEKIKLVTSEQLQNCANKYFNDNYVLAVLKP